MADKSSIKWTDATWNPVTGCTKITKGCDNCHAERFAERWRGIRGHSCEQGFDLRLWQSRLEQPAQWRKPRMIFVNSMSDPFHKDMDRAFIDRVFDTMEAVDRHVYQALTKRSSLMKGYLLERYSGSPAPEHIWFGVSVEDRTAISRIRHLQDTPASIRFLSIEPLLGPVGEIGLEGISRVIVGGKSGPNARPMQPEWVHEIRDRCKGEDVPFFFKQWGGRTPKAGDGNSMAWSTTTCLHACRRRKKRHMEFRWHPDERPPGIEGHSKAKLDVLRSYLRAYIDRLNNNPQRDRFKLDLVDGFAGGGVYLSEEGEIVPGSPLIMLEEIGRAKERLNRDRRKPLDFDCRFHFVDREQAHTDHLGKTLTDRGHDASGPEISLHTGPFRDHCERIIDEIRRRHPRSGRAIFLLDQTGYSQVDLGLVRDIFRQLAAAEVILTFAADALINHLPGTPELARSIEAAELSREQILDMIGQGGERGRAFMQRALLDHICKVTEVPFYTPFFIRPGGSRRALWFLHLSGHPTARDVMVQRHWDIGNTFEHYGSGGFRMLGWDELRESETVPLFNFEKEDSSNLQEELIDPLVHRLRALTAERPVTYGSVRTAYANCTAARFSDLDKVVLRLAREGEIDILGPDGRPYSGNRRTIRETNLICPPSRMLIPGLSRIRS